MKVLLAGATGAIGTPLIRSLRNEGHAVYGMTHSRDGAVSLAAKGADAVVADALDSESVLEAVRRVGPDAILNELTALPKHYTPEAMKAAAPRDREVRIKGNANLLSAARAVNCRRYLLQSSAFWYAPFTVLLACTTSWTASHPNSANGFRLSRATQELPSRFISRKRTPCNWPDPT